MFDDGFAPEAPWWVDEPTTPGPIPEEPAWLHEEPMQDLDAVGAEIEAWLASLPPEERYEQTFGHAASTEELDRFAPPSLELSVFLQDRAVEAARVRTVADARRIAALLVADDASVADLIVRFGAKVGAREGMGGRAVASSIALLTKTDPRQISHEITAGRFLRDRLPTTWAVFQAGETTWARAQKAVTRATGLDEAHLPAFDAAAAVIVVTSTRVKKDLRTAREALQAETAADRARSTFERRHTTIEAGDDCGAALVIEGLASDWVPVQNALHRLAVAAHGVDPLGRGVAQLRHDIARRAFALGLDAYQASVAAGNEVVPAGTKVDVSLTLTVPVLGWLGVTTEQAVLGGYGPIAMEQAKALAGTAKSFVRVLTDPITGVRLAMDRTARKPPADLDRWIRIRDGRTRFPGKATPAHLCDIDHAREWQDGGPTNAENLITLDRPSHNAKSAGLYDDLHRDDGVVEITDPWGRVFEDPPEDPMAAVPPDLLPRRTPPDDEPCPF